MGEGGGAGWDNLLQYFISLLNHVYTSRGTWNSSLMDENEVVVELGLVHAEVVGQHRDHHHCVRRWLAVRCRGRVELVRHVCGCALRVVAGPGAARTGCTRLGYTYRYCIQPQSVLSHTAEGWGQAAELKSEQLDIISPPGFLFPLYSSLPD